MTTHCIAPSRPLPLMALGLVLLALGEGTTEAATLVVDSLADTADADAGDGTCDDGSGACTLRAAIETANGQPGPDVVVFDLPGPGPWIIRPLSGLPTIEDPLHVDGSSQPGHVDAPVIELDGSSVAGFPNGLRVSTFDCRLTALAIHGFPASGLVLSSGGRHVIEGCHLGLDADGSVAPGNGVHGVHVVDSATNTLLDNVIAANASHGLHVSGAASADVMILGNAIGSDPSGDTIQGQGLRGVSVSGAPRVILGGPAEGDGNRIVGSGTEAVALVQGASDGVVEGNVIGGEGAASNFLGLLLHDADGHRVGGLGEGAGNVISGNFLGVRLRGECDANEIAGNLIGVTADLAPLGNETAGIRVDASLGASTIRGNVIAFNGAEGVEIRAGLGTVVVENAVHDNGALGIDLGGDGVTPNDPLDADAGANGLANAPSIDVVSADCMATAVEGSVSGAPSARIRVDVHVGPSCDDSGFGEGATWLGSTEMLTDSSGAASWSFEHAQRLEPVDFRDRRRDVG